MLASIFSLNVLQTALELGCIYALVALALFLSYSILNIADLSTDGCFTLGCAVACQVALTGHPILALFAAMAAGVCSGFVTAFLQTRLGVESIMAGIIVNTGLYTINLAVMGFSSTMSLVKTDTVFSLAKGSLSFLGGWYKLAIALAMILLASAAMLGFLGTRLGLSIRATGDNAAMVRASSINPAFTITVGLCISGALCALSGGLLAQYQKSCDINVGTGMVTIALASLIIGETLLGKRTMLRRIIGVVFGGLMFLLKDAIVGFYTVSEETKALALSFLTVLSVAIVGSCYEYPVEGGVIAGGGDTKYTAVVDNLFMWLFTIPSAYLSAFVFRFPPVVTFCFLKADQLLKCIPNAIVCNRYRWVRTLTRDDEAPAR